MTDAMHGDDHHTRIGKKVLSSTFIGGPVPGWYGHLPRVPQARPLHHDDLQPHLDEIKTQLNGARIQDRPDLVARVFKQKKERLMDDIEFHVHILVILREEDRMTTAAQVNETICAKLPPHPDTAPTDEARARFERLNRTVLTNMIHDPCGAQNPNSS